LDRELKDVVVVVVVVVVVAAAAAAAALIRYPELTIVLETSSCDSK
jgi:hypothetical protein